MNDVTYTLNLDGKDPAITCMCCAYFLSYQEEYQTHLDPHDYGSCRNPDVANKTLRFGAYMTCSLHKAVHCQFITVDLSKPGNWTSNNC